MFAQAMSSTRPTAASSSVNGVTFLARPVEIPRAPLAISTPTRAIRSRAASSIELPARSVRNCRSAVVTAVCAACCDWPGSSRPISESQ